MSDVTLNPEVTEMILDAGGEDLRMCYQCGTCTGSCPWNMLSGLNPRGVIRKGQFGLEGFEGEELWKCVTCNTCMVRCPRQVDITGIMRSMRSILVEMDQYPKSLRTALNSLDQEGNPWLGLKSERPAWIQGMDVKTYTEGTEYLLFSCCTTAYDPRTQKIARDLVKIFQSVGLDFGILDHETTCCGDPAHNIGNPELFENLKDENEGVFSQYGVKKIITISPHCYKTFSDLYDMEGVEILHYTQVLADLIESGVLKPKGLDGTITYHDPCYLGRHSGEYEAPRKVVESLGMQFTEMERNRDRALCCGGGGGGAWRETKTGDRLAELRIEEAVGTGAKVVATACPFCMLMLEDGAKSLNKDEDIQIRDLAELVASSL
ncbi:MAG: (Fe-S)-binding protein [Deltaproteobacteria bacterium]|nr:(Fe-S)-binding protein [Deltaproteobacteria bacterium]